MTTEGPRDAARRKRAALKPAIVTHRQRELRARALELAVLSHGDVFIDSAPAGVFALADQFLAYINGDHQ